MNVLTWLQQIRFLARSRLILKKLYHSDEFQDTVLNFQALDNCQRVFRGMIFKIFEYFCKRTWKTLSNYAINL